MGEVEANGNGPSCHPKVSQELEKGLLREYWLEGGPRWLPAEYITKFQSEFIPYLIKMFWTVLEAVLCVFMNPTFEIAWEQELRLFLSVVLCSSSSSFIVFSS